jgi:hypothetical protein
MKHKIILFLLFYFILFYSIISKHNKKLISHYFKSNNIYYYDKTIRNLIIKYNISNGLLYLVKLIIFLRCFFVLPCNSVLYGLILHKKYNVSMLKLIMFFFKNPLSIK